MKITIFKKATLIGQSKEEAARKASDGEVVEIKNHNFFFELIKKFAWSPSVFKENKRKNTNFIETSLMVLDIDEGMSLREALEQVKLLGYTTIVGTTPTHQQEKNGVIADRYRVIFPLSYPITSPEIFTTTMKVLHTSFPVSDPNCKDLARFYFPCSRVAFQEGYRKLIPVHETNPEILPVVQNIQKDGFGQLSNRTREFLDKGAPEGQWHLEFIIAARDIKAQGYSLQEAGTMLSQITGQLDSKHDLNQLRYIYSENTHDFEYRPERKE